MAINYTEFDSTPATIFADLRTAILGSSDWSDISPVPINVTNSVANVTSNANMTLTSAAGLVVGQSIVVEGGGAREENRMITAISGNVITVNSNWAQVHPIGSAVATRAMVLRSVSTSGAALIIDLQADLYATHYLGLAFYRDWSGTAPGGWVDREPGYLYWKAQGGTTTMPVHCTVSAGKDHLFIAVEGPRAWEANTTSTTYGSVKNYVFLSEVTRYHANDTTPCAVAGATSTNTATAAVTANSHQVAISRDSANTQSWSVGRLTTLTFPTLYSTDEVPGNRVCTIDGQTYLLPYVLFSQSEGIRGRLSRLFYANTNAPSPSTDYPDPVNTLVTFDGVVYKLVPVNKSDGTVNSWGPFGSINQGTAVTRSFLVAVPYAEAA